jgi:lipopolysaccharide export system protein LptA
MNASRHAQSQSFCHCLLALSLCLSAAPVLADRGDRDKPVNLAADRMTVDEGKKVQVLDGNVELVQGTLIIHADKLVVTQDANGFQKGVAYGTPGHLATFRQKREGKDEYIDGEAERIEHDGKSEKTELFDKAHLKSGLDEVQGQYISYDGKTENYLVTSGPSAAGTGKGNRQERVRAVIQPKNREPAKPATPPTKSPGTADTAKTGD